MTFYEDLFRALGERQIRYLVVGGVAVILHGFVRATADLDLMLALDSANVTAFLELMKQRGYKSKIPVGLEEFADPDKRKSWRQEKGMLVFSIYHPQKSQELIDVFVDEPIPFTEAYDHRKILNLGSTPVSVISSKDLIRMKKQAGRPQDLQDIQALEDKAHD